MYTQPSRILIPVGWCFAFRRINSFSRNCFFSSRNCFSLSRNGFFSSGSVQSSIAFSTASKLSRCLSRLPRYFSQLSRCLWESWEKYRGSRESYWWLYRSWREEAIAWQGEAIARICSTFSTNVILRTQTDSVGFDMNLHNFKQNITVFTLARQLGLSGSLLLCYAYFN